MSTLVPGWLYTDPPPLFFPIPLSPSQRFPFSNACPPMTTLRYRLHIVQYNSTEYGMEGSDTYIITINAPLIWKCGRFFIRCKTYHGAFWGPSKNPLKFLCLMHTHTPLHTTHTHLRAIIYYKPPGAIIINQRTICIWKCGTLYFSTAHGLFRNIMSPIILNSPEISCSENPHESVTYSMKASGT
jgi:hypothetical protein